MSRMSSLHAVRIPSLNDTKPWWTGLRMTVRQSWTGQPRLSEESRPWAKMSLKGPLCQWNHCTVLSGTMTVLTVFRSVSELHKPKQGRAAEGVGAEATVHWTNIITTKALSSAWKGLHWRILLFTGQQQQEDHVLQLYFAPERARGVVLPALREGISQEVMYRCYSQVVLTATHTYSLLRGKIASTSQKVIALSAVLQCVFHSCLLCNSDLWTRSLLGRIAGTSVSTQSSPRNQIRIKVNSLGLMTWPLAGSQHKAKSRMSSNISSLYENVYSQETTTKRRERDKSWGIRHEHPYQEGHGY